MTDASAAVVEQRVVSVFNSDDDLTNFLAGLRAKYASLYPKVPDTDISQDAHGPAPAAGAPDARSASDPFSATTTAAAAAAADSAPPFLAATSQSFELKMSQLRSSLQSLQHILPPRTSTTANLLDSFMAVSSDRTVPGVAAAGIAVAGIAAAGVAEAGVTAASAAVPGSAVGVLSLVNAAAEAGQQRSDAPALAATHAGAAELTWGDVPIAATQMGSGTAPHDADSVRVSAWASASGPSQADNLGSVNALTTTAGACSPHLGYYPAGGPAAAPHLRPDALISGQPSASYPASAAVTAVAAATAAAAAASYEAAAARVSEPGGGDPDGTAPDAVFTELAAGYSRRALQPDSSEVSTSSFDGGGGGGRADGPGAPVVAAAAVLQPAGLGGGFVDDGRGATAADGGAFGVGGGGGVDATTSASLEDWQTAAAVAAAGPPAAAQGDESLPAGPAAAVPRAAATLRVLTHPEEGPPPMRAGTESGEFVSAEPDVPLHNHNYQGQHSHRQLPLHQHGQHQQQWPDSYMVTERWGGGELGEGLAASQTAAAWRPHGAGRSPTRRRAWQLVGEGDGGGGAETTIGPDSLHHHRHAPQPNIYEIAGAADADSGGGGWVGAGTADGPAPRGPSEDGNGFGYDSYVGFGAGIPVGDAGPLPLDAAAGAYDWLPAAVGAPAVPEPGPDRRHPTFVAGGQPGGGPPTTRESSAAAWESSAEDEGGATVAEVEAEDEGGATAAAVEAEAAAGGGAASGPDLDGSGWATELLAAAPPPPPAAEAMVAMPPPPRSDSPVLPAVARCGDDVGRTGGSPGPAWPLQRSSPRGDPRGGDVRHSPWGGGLPRQQLHDMVSPQYPEEQYAQQQHGQHRQQYSQQQYRHQEQQYPPQQQFHHQEQQFHHQGQYHHHHQEQPEQRPARSPRADLQGPSPGSSGWLQGPHRLSPRQASSHQASSPPQDFFNAVRRSWGQPPQQQLSPSPQSQSQPGGQEAAAAAVWQGEEWAAEEEAVRQDAADPGPAAAVAHQRQRRRWGSPSQREEPLHLHAQAPQSSLPPSPPYGIPPAGHAAAAPWDLSGGPAALTELPSSPDHGGGGGGGRSQWLRPRPGADGASAGSGTGSARPTSPPTGSGGGSRGRRLWGSPGRGDPQAAGDPPTGPPKAEEQVLPSWLVTEPAAAPVATSSDVPQVEPGGDGAARRGTGSAGGDSPAATRGSPSAATGAADDGAWAGASGLQEGAPLELQEPGAPVSSTALEPSRHQQEQQEAGEGPARQQRQERPRGLGSQRSLRLLPPPPPPGPPAEAPVPVPAPVLKALEEEEEEEDVEEKGGVPSVPTPLLEQPLRQQTSVDVWLQPGTGPADVRSGGRSDGEAGVRSGVRSGDRPAGIQSGGELGERRGAAASGSVAASPGNDEVLCGSPTEALRCGGAAAAAGAAGAADPRPRPAPSAPTAGAHPSDYPGSEVRGRGAVDTALEGHDGGGEAGEAGDEGGSSAAAGGITMSRGGVAFSISMDATSVDEATAAAGGRLPRGPTGLAPTAATGTAAADSAVVTVAAAAAAAMTTTTAATAAATGGVQAPGALPVSTDWERLNRQLREAGFSAFVMAAAVAAHTAPEAAAEAAAPAAAHTAPEPGSLFRCLSSVLEQYVRRNRLVAELLAATEQSGRVAEEQEAAIRELKRQASAARAAAERAKRDLADVSSQQLPKVEARHAVQLGRLRSETTKLKEVLRASELELAARTEEIRSLRATVSGLQSASSHSADVEGAALRQRVAQLEGLLRTRDKEVEKLRATKEVVVGQAEDGQANALDRAYEAEAAARRLEAEAAAARNRVGQLEQGLRQRERDVASMREDLQQIKACEAAARLVAQERGAAAEEAARRAEAEAAALRGKVRELEAVVRAARQELEKQRLESDALRSSAYEVVYRQEDECRVLAADLATSRSRVSQLEHVVRAKDREVARARDEKEAARAAERERARAAEEVSVRLETELTSAKVRLTQVEGALRGRERELAKLAELLRQTQGAEVDAWIKQAKLEEGSRKLETDFTSLRLRVLQLEAALKGRDKECDKLARTVEALRTEAHELTSRLAKSEESGRKVEAELATSRGKVLNLEGQVRVKEREQERLVRLVTGLKAADAEVANRQGALEDAARRLDGALAAARGRVTALEGVVRARDAAVERLSRQLEALKTADFERSAQALKTEEAARQQDTEAAGLRTRILHLEGQLRAKDRELERAARQLDAAAAADADAMRRLADAAAAAARLEAEVAAGRGRAAQLGEALRAREREVAALSRALEARRAAEHEANAVAGRTEETARKLDGEAAELRQRLVQTEGQLRSRERDAERQARALEAAQAAAAEAALRQGEAEAAVRRLEAEAAGLRQRLTAAEGAVRAREKELERLEKAADQARGGEASAEARLRTSEASVAQLEGQLGAMRLRISQLEAAARGQAKEVERLTRALDQGKTAQEDAATRVQRSDESTRQMVSELTSARSRLAKLEASLAAREQEGQRLQRLLAAAEAQAATQASRSDDFVRRVEGDLGSMRQQAAQLAGLIRGRDRQLATLRGALEAAQAAEARAAEQRRQAEEALRKVEGDLAAERQRAVQLEGQVKSRERDLERLGRQLDAGRDQNHGAVAAADREVAALKDSAARAEAALATARARVTQLESELVSRQRQLEELQRLVGSSRTGDAEAAAAAEARAGRAEEAARRLDAELGAVRQRYNQLEHTFRGRETTLDRLKAALADKVAAEERRLARDKAAYQRIRAAYVATKGAGGGEGGPGGGTPGQQQQQRAAGAMAMAARELRPVEIVGLYETRREAAEQELAAYRAEVRSLAEQLREAQNHIALKDRTAAWRTPTELADMQARIILLERRTADLQRELDRARLEAAEAGRAAERRLAEAEHRAAQLKEDKEALIHELDSRPTLQENRSLKREVEILEKRLLQVKGSTAANGAGADAEGGETALSLAAAAKSRHAGALMTTQQRIARDRSIHRLGLRGLEDWPKDVLVDLLQDVCIELDLRDATTLPAAVRKTLRVVGAVPRMEAFIGAVCERVYGKGGAFVPPHIDGTTDPSKVLEVLEVWLGLLQEGAQLRGAMRAVVEALAARAEGMATPIHGPGDVVISVRQLVEAEVAALTARESLASAAEHMAREPEHLLTRLVSHFMRLFDCPSLDGVVPAVNRLYVTLNELRNFARALATALELPADAGLSACMSRVRELLDAARAGGAGTADAPPHGVKRPAEVSAAAAASASPASAAAAVGGVEVSAALERFMLVFGARTTSAAAEAAEKAVARLRRLDEVLPRYQRLASQLFEALRVTSLEEIMPALRAALQQ